MKFTKAVALVMSLSVIGMGISACNNQPEPVSSDVNIISTQSQNSGEVIAPSATVNVDEGFSGFYFEYNGVKLAPNMVMDESKFPDDSYEFATVASCAGQGMATSYDFKGGSFNVETYPGSDVIYVISIFDDTVTTPEGICIGKTIDDAKAVYGEPTAEFEAGVTFAKEGTELRLQLDGTGVITAIVYIAQI